MSEGAAAVVFDGRGRLLLVKENYGKFRWSLPGGRVEPGETPEEAVVREALEETGASVAIEHLIGTYELDDGFSVHVFRCAVVAGTPTLQTSDELAAVTWFETEEIPHPRSNALHHALPDAVAGRRDLVRRNVRKLT